MKDTRYASSKTAPPQGAPSHSVLRGHLLSTVRVVWVALAVLSVGLLLASVPARYETLRSACLGSSECAIGQLSSQELRALSDLSLDSYVAYQVALQIGFSVVFLTCATVVFYRRSDERMALFASFALLVAAPAISMYGLEDLHPVWGMVVQIFTFLFWSSILPFLFIFPDGRFVPRWTCWVAIFVIVLQVPQFFFPESLLSSENWPPLLYATLTLGLWGTALFAQVYRYRNVSNRVARQQTKWIVFGFVAAFLVGLGFLLIEAVFSSFARSGASYEVFRATGAAFIWSLVPLSIGVSVPRYRLWDIDPVVNRALVYGGLTACVVGISVLVVGYLGAAFRLDNDFVISLVATGLIAVLFAPLRDRLQSAVNRLMYGERDDPYAVLSRLGQRLEATLEPRAVLPAIVETVAQALKLPYAAIALKETGEHSGFTVAGRLPDPPAARLPAPDRRGTSARPASGRRGILGGRSSPLGRPLVRQAGIAAHAVRLTADLQRARERLVSAREEERRRLRRDLHDGLGPQLSSQTLTIDAVRSLMRRDSDAAETLLLDLKAQAKDAITDIRRLVYDLRPPALDDLGLLGAMRETAAKCGQNGLAVSVEVPDQLPPLPAAVEVAAYRIAGEATTNVVRHAGASECAVRLTLDEAFGALVLEVRDDGRGITEDHSAGVGLSSMRERAEELGGSFTIEASSEGGTVVRAALPLPEEG